jgi:hypothetical protein
MPVAPSVRKVLECNAQRLRIAVVRATKFRISETNSLSEKLAKLEGDLKNVASHVFGEHAECSKINYFPCSPPENEKNVVPIMKDWFVSTHSDMLFKIKPQFAQSYFEYGHQYSLRRGYQTRCEAAAILLNCGGNFFSGIHHAFVEKNSYEIHEKVYF